MHCFHFVADIANLFINLRLEVIITGMLPYLVNDFASGILRMKKGILLSLHLRCLLIIVIQIGAFKCKAANERMVHLLWPRLILVPTRIV